MNKTTKSNAMRQKATSMVVAGENNANANTTANENRKLNSQLRDAERAVHRAKSELRQMKAQSATMMAEKETKITLLEQQVKRANGKARQAIKHWQEKHQNLEAESTKKIETLETQKEDEIQQVQNDLQSISKRLNQCQTTLEKCGYDPISMEPLDENVAMNEKEREEKRIEFQNQMQELSAILEAREEALTKKLESIVQLNNDLEKAEESMDSIPFVNENESHETKTE